MWFGPHHADPFHGEFLQIGRDVVVGDVVSTGLLTRFEKLAVIDDVLMTVSRTYFQVSWYAKVEAIFSETLMVIFFFLVCARRLNSLQSRV